MEVSPENGEDVRRGAADIDRQDVLIPFLGHFLNYDAHRRRRRHNVSGRDLHQLRIARRLLHDVFQEEVVDRLARLHHVFPVKVGPDVVDVPYGAHSAQHILDHVSRFHVAAENDRQVEALPEPRLRLRGADNFRYHLNVPSGAAVCAARHQYHVGADVPESFYPFVILPRVVEGNGVDNDGARAKSRSFRAGARNRAHNARAGHLQSPAGGTGRKISVNAVVAPPGADQVPVFIQKPAPCNILQFLDRVLYAHRHVVEGRLDRRGRFAAPRQAVSLLGQDDQNCLGGRAAAVGRQHHFQFLSVFTHT